MRKLFGFLLFSAVITSCSSKKESVRSIEKFNAGWRFALVSDSNTMASDYNDNDWRTLNLPHDWSIEGGFSEKNPATVGGGALPGGIGWYRKMFMLSEADSVKKIFIHFDGVYCCSEVYVNGHLAGKRPNGYISFEYDITPFLQFGQKANIIAVKVDNSKQPNSRWYSGSGIYRNVWLIKTNPVHVDLWGLKITTPKVDSTKAEVVLQTSVRNLLQHTADVEVIAQIYNPEGNMLSMVSSKIAIEKEKTGQTEQIINVDNPELWSIDNPSLYLAKIIIRKEGKIIDQYENKFGIRYFAFDTAKGFILNGKPLKIVGVCNHHDLGCFGAAINTRAIERQLEIMKDMGINGIRTSHNPPAPELLDLCDRMGFVVMDESFDMWAKKKTEFDYSQYWNEWHEKDLTDHILRDRNHPSVFIWSIGNEILEQWDSTGITIARELAGIVRKIDATRPITSGCNDPRPENNIIKSGALDLIGYNYHHETFEAFPTVFPGKAFIGTETVSSLNTRGSYDMPSDSIRRWPVRWDLPFTTGNANHSCSSYDNCSAPWGSTHEETWKILKKHDFLSGCFIWTGFDYLGEPTPYGWPSRSSYFGIIDLAGFPKDPYYMYQSECTNKPVLHIFPHWNWTDGQDIDIWAYTNCTEVELFVNGASQGIKSKQGDDLHLVWKVKYAPGSLKAVGKNSDGTSQQVIINTAGAPAKILLEADRNKINADGEDLSFVKVSILDKDGNLVPHADNLVNFEIVGDAIIAGVDNGSQTSMESFKANHRKAFNGLCLAVIQSKNTKGTVTLKATSEGLQPAEINITIK